MQIYEVEAYWKSSGHICWSNWT